jgi:hypothetical protein
MLGENDRSTLLALTNLAEILRAQGSLRAVREMQEDVLARSRPTLGDGDTITLAAMASLGAIIEQQGNLAGARRQFEEVVAISIRRSGE